MKKAKCTREHVLRQFGQSFVDERFDLKKNAIQTKAEISYAIAMVDKIGGWEEENRVRSRFAAIMWKNTKSVVCNDQNNMHNYRLLKF